jgi:hypothetical protein
MLHKSIGTTIREWLGDGDEEDIRGQIGRTCDSVEEHDVLSHLRGGARVHPHAGGRRNPQDHPATTEETVTTITLRHQVSSGEHRNPVGGNGIIARAMPMGTTQICM